MPISSTKRMYRCLVDMGFASCPGVGSIVRRSMRRRNFSKTAASAYRCQSTSPDSIGVSASAWHGMRRGVKCQSGRDAGTLAE